MASADADLIADAKARGIFEGEVLATLKNIETEMKEFTTKHRALELKIEKNTSEIQKFAIWRSKIKGIQIGASAVSGAIGGAVVALISVYV